mgnify:FL=1
MNTDLIKYITFFSLFIVCININGKIMLDENDKLVSPLPKPYDGLVYSCLLYTSDAADDP